MGGVEIGNGILNINIEIKSKMTNTDKTIDNAYELLTLL